MDLKEFFRHPSQLSEFFWEVIEHTGDAKFVLIQEFREDLVQLKADHYAERIADNFPIENCFGFMDCTLVRTSRPNSGMKYNDPFTMDTNGAMA
jgi:hypothetical protein